MRYVLGYLTALCLLVLIICQSVIIPTFFMPFYRQQYARLERAEYIGIESAELERVTLELLDYMRGRRDSLQGIRATIGGVEQEFFSYYRDIIHMYDVRVLYDRLFIVRNVSFFSFIGLLLLMALTKSPIGYLLSRCSREVIVGFLLLSLVIAGIIAINFEQAWEIFHHIFFDNDLWLLTPPRDRLIMMFPLEFFRNISIFIGGLLLGASLFVIIASTVYLKRDYKPMFGRYI